MTTNRTPVNHDRTVRPYASQQGKPLARSARRVGSVRLGKAHHGRAGEAPAMTVPTLGEGQRPRAGTGTRLSHGGRGGNRAPPNDSTRPLPDRMKVCLIFIWLGVGASYRRGILGVVGGWGSCLVLVCRDCARACLPAIGALKTSSRLKIASGQTRKLTVPSSAAMVNCSCLVWPG
jgi:hypothetical protein